MQDGQVCVTAGCIDELVDGPPGDPLQRRLPLVGRAELIRRDPESVARLRCRTNPREPSTVSR